MLPLAIPTAFLGDEALTQGSQGPLIRYKVAVCIRLAFHTIVRHKNAFRTSFGVPHSPTGFCILVLFLFLDCYQLPFI